GGEQRKEKERLTTLTAKSHDLQDLLDSIQRNEHIRAGERAAFAPSSGKHAWQTHKERLRSFAGARGGVQLPARGRVTNHFGRNDGTAFTKGFVIDTREHAAVVAPFDGEVVFAGPFRDYGRMVILRHNDEYHTLLSGLEHLDCSVGQFLIKGEPI